MPSSPADSPRIVELASRMEALDRVHEPVTHHMRGALYAMVLHLDLLAMTVRSDADDEATGGAGRRVFALQRQFTEFRKRFEQWMSVVRPPADPTEASDLRAALDDVVLMVEGLAASHGVRLELALDEDAPRPRVTAQPQRLRLALLQLLLNALESGGRNVRLEVEAAGGQATVRVIDDGNGATAETLGLGVARAVLRDYQGDVLLSRAPGSSAGTVAEARLPETAASSPSSPR
jgi:signal transduction histidine kinase